MSFEDQGGPYYEEEEYYEPNEYGGYGEDYSSYYYNPNSYQYGGMDDFMSPWKLTQQDYPLPSMPTDLRYIMDMKWSPTQDLLLIPFQDGMLKGWHFDRRFGRNEAEPQAVMNVCLEYPVATMDFVDDGCNLVYGDFDGNVLFFDLETEDVTYFGSHEIGVTSVHYYPRHSLAVTLGEDSSMKVYDSREERPVFDFNMNCGVPYTSDLKKDVLIFNTNTNQISILDLDLVFKKGGIEYATFEGPLYHKIEQVALNSDCSQFSMVGGEGRIAVRELNMRRPFNYQEMQKPTYNLHSNFSFKCHRDQGDPHFQHIKQINQIVYHPRRHDVLATCGSDGSYFIWNLRLQKVILRNRPLPNPKTPVSNIAFNRDGSLFAYVVGDDGSRGVHVERKWSFGYFVRVLLDTDLQVRNF